MSDDWRLRVEMNDDRSAHQLTDRLANFDREHDLSTSFADRVAVSRDDAEVFCYADTRDQIDAAEKAIRALAEEHHWQLTTELQRWHSAAEEWEDPDAALPDSDASLAAEHAELIENEREESEAQGYPEYEVRVQCPSQRDAEQLADRLRARGSRAPSAGSSSSSERPTRTARRRWPSGFAARRRPGSTVTAQGSEQEAVDEAPYSTPFSPFAVFGGLGG